LYSPRRLIALLFHARNFFLTFFEGGTRTHTHKDPLLICGRSSPTGRGFEIKLPAGFTPLSGAAASATALAAETTTGTAPAAFAFRPGFIDIQRSAVQLVPVQRGDGAIRFIGIGHFDKCEAPGTPGLAICNHTHTLYFSVRLKQRADRRLRGREIQISYKNILHLISLTFCGSLLSDCAG
jgi:hypothetical protein